jgi:hypothetical protein
MIIQKTNLSRKLNETFSHARLMCVYFLWQQSSHIDFQDRREEAELEARADYVFDPTMVETPGGQRLPWELVKMMNLPNMFEPIVADHKDPK